jgi:hypothetical protein
VEEIVGRGRSVEVVPRIIAIRMKEISLFD